MSVQDKTDFTQGSIIRKMLPFMGPILGALILQGFPTFEFSFLFKVSSQIFSYFLVFFPAILVNPLVKQASLPTGFFNYSLSDILLPLHHQNSHGCKCSRLH